MTTLMVHSAGSSLLNVVKSHSLNVIQGHHHSVAGCEFWADSSLLRWSLGVGSLLNPNSPAARYGSKAVLKRPILGCGVLIGPKNTLVISDLHVPYHHDCSFRFLKRVAELYECEKVLNVGDIVDHHSGSFHTSETDAMTPDEEFDLTIAQLHKLQAIFPKMIITRGNHDDIPKRQAKEQGLSTRFLSDLNKIYELDNGWKWVDQYEFDTKIGHPVFIPMTLKPGGKWDGKVYR